MFGPWTYDEVTGFLVVGGLVVTVLIMTLVGGIHFYRVGLGL